MAKKQQAKKAGRPPFKASAEQKAKVEALAGFGAPEAYIAREIKVCEHTLRKYFRDELDHGMSKANAAVAQSLFKKAIGTGQGAVAAGIFWAKTRMGWKETTSHEHSGKDGEAIKHAHAADESFIAFVSAMEGAAASKSGGT